MLSLELKDASYAGNAKQGRECSGRAGGGANSRGNLASCELILIAWG